MPASDPGPSATIWLWERSSEERDLRPAHSRSVIEVLKI